MTADDEFAVCNVIARLALYADGLHRGKGQGDCRNDGESRASMAGVTEHRSPIQARILCA